ncbi:LacI family DNA-binding transcriptional regulator [Cellulosimicrobium arenosum]|uniref:LacI family DNA-binding transcriptional regulator n=1 Tax=Cellulosimicrobium arenosum TaxID=2708133 RepID=A0A927PEZ6_9MICO|nr:LacI family DNA-binding transcriptional regulator [Cellulosimicrobium arenosum]MBD8079864.1 LacI family DNA-binding transcriptional regulator [Cellulosimicrobium arenosum]
MSVSVRDVAARAGVSVGTVSNVLNRPERVSGTTVDRVRDAIRELGFVRNDAARQLRAGRSQSIGLVILDVGNPFFTELARGAEERAAALGLAVLLGNSGEDPAREARYLDLFEEQRVRGVLISSVGEVTEQLERLRNRGTATVFVDRRAGDLPFSSVSVDDVAGGRLAAQHLIEQGRRRIAFVGGPRDLHQVRDRLAGARSAVEAAPGCMLEVIETESLTVRQGSLAGAAIAARDAADRPDAVFAANDLLAVGVLQAAAQAEGLRVPDELAIIGYDDIAFAASTVTPLSSVRQPSHLIGQTGVEILVREAEEPDTPREQIEFQPELVPRASTGA